MGEGGENFKQPALCSPPSPLSSVCFSVHTDTHTTFEHETTLNKTRDKNIFYNEGKNADIFISVKNSHTNFVRESPAKNFQQLTPERNNFYSERNIFTEIPQNSVTELQDEKKFTKNKFEFERKRKLSEFG